MAERPPSAAPAERPGAEHDDRLRRLVAPPDWADPAPAERYDLVVLGGGTAGLVSAAVGAGLGARVALVEREALGGDCLVTGCVPSKALLRSARAAADARSLGELGIVVTGEPSVDFGAVMERLRRIRAELAVHDSAARFRDLGVDVFLGAGRFTGRDRIEVDPRGARGRAGGGSAPSGAVELRFRRAIVATGARPAVPPIEGLESAGFVTSETVWDLAARPARLAVLGGGPIGCELAQAFARLGSRVVLVEEQGRILPNDDPDAAAVVAAALERDGVELRLGRSLERVGQGSAGAVLEIAGGEASGRGRGGAEIREVDRILVAVGRLPNVAGLGLESAGIALDERRGIAVDEGLRTTNPRVYAAGDVCALPRFTHVADAHARIAVRNALFPGRQRANVRAVPWCTFTDPELAQVGHTARSAAAAGIAVTTYDQAMSGVDRCVLEGETEGFARIHVRKGTDEIVGATVVAAHAGEMIAEVAVAIAGGLGLGALSQVVHAYPTRAEAIRKLGDQAQRARLTPRARRVIQAWLQFAR